MNNGIYEYEGGVNPYDIGTLVVEVKETEKSLLLKIIEKNMRFSTYVDVLFGNNNEVRINKGKTPHAVTCGNSWFIVYPNRLGAPLCFSKKGGAE